MNSPGTQAEKPVAENSWTGDDKISSDVGPLTGPWEVRFLAPFDTINLYPSGKTSFDKLEFNIDKNGNPQFFSESNRVRPTPPGAAAFPNFGLLFATYRSVPDFLSSRPGSVFKSLHYIDRNGNTTPLLISTEKDSTEKAQIRPAFAEDCNEDISAPPTLFGMFLLILFEPGHPNLDLNTGAFGNPKSSENKISTFERAIHQDPSKQLLNFLFPNSSVDEDPTKPSPDAKAITVRLSKPIRYRY